MKTRSKVTSLLLAFPLIMGSSVLLGCKFYNPNEDENFKYTLKKDKTYEISASKRLLSKVTIPEKFNGTKVTSVGDRVFQGQNQLTGVTISKNLESINYGAFMNCSQLRELHFADESHLKTIGSNAFCNSSNLIIDHLPRSVTDVGPFAFQYVRGISLMYLPEEIQTIGSCAFEGCSNAIFLIESNSTDGWDENWNKGGRPYLTGVDEDYEGMEIQDRGNFKVLINYDEAHLIGVINQSELEGDILLPSQVNDVPIKSVISNLFSPSAKNNKVTSVIIPSGYNMPDLHAFDGLECANLYFVNQEVTPPEWISEFESIHNGCTAYSMVTDEKLDNGINYIKSNNNAVLTQNMTATGQIKPSTTISFTSGDASLTEIAPRAFRNNISVTGLALDGITLDKIGDYAFYGCTGLTTVNLGSTKVIGKSAFSGSTSMSAINKITADNPSLVTTIGEEAFKKSKTTQIDITELFTQNNSITSIGKSAFDNCLLANEDIYFNDNLQRLQQYTFHDADETTTFHVSNTLFDAMKGWGYKITQYTDITGVYYTIDSTTRPLGHGHIVVDQA